MPVNQIARTLPVTRPAVSQHLKVLKDVGLVLDTRSGTRRLYSLNPDGLARLRAHFDQMWSAALAGFQAAAEVPDPGDSNASKSRIRRPKIGSRQRSR
jgi:DNA-binding MarR family transcriptional regulator